MKTLELRDIAVHFGRLQALDGLDLALEGSRVTLLAGPNGSGKSTLLRVLLGLVRPNRGRIVVDGSEVRVDGALKQRLGYLPESVAFSEALSGREVLSFFARARGVARVRVAATLERVGLSTAADRPVRDYSRGMRQRLGLGVAILSTPELLVLDEPSGGLDQDGLAVLWSILDEWRAAGRIVLMASHEIALLETRVDSVCLLASGRRVADGTPAELRRWAGLPLRIHMRLDQNGHAADAKALLFSMRLARPDAEIVEHDAEVEIEIAQSELLPLLDIGARHPGALRDLRVQEPPFDEVYRRLIETAKETR